MYEFKRMEDLLECMKDNYRREMGIRSKIEEDLRKEQKKIDECKKELELFEKKKALINEACFEARKLARDLFASIASHGLQHVLGTHYSVLIKLGTKGEDPTADFYVKSKYDDYEVEVDPTEEEGGGVADIVALTAFFSLNAFQKNKNNAPLFLDEPTKFVSSGYAADVAEFIKAISKDLNKQIIMVTHDTTSKTIADKAYEISLDNNGVSIVKDVSRTGVT